MKFLFFIIASILGSTHSLVGHPTIKLRTNDDGSLKTPEDTIVKAISKSSKIIIGIFCLTNHKITKALIAAAKTGASITIIADYQQALHRSSTIQSLALLRGISVYVVSSKTLHSKVLCLVYKNGKHIVIDGSFNLSKNATKNRETVVVHNNEEFYKITIGSILKMIENGRATPLDAKKLQEMRERNDRRHLEKTPRRPAFSPIRVPPTPTRSRPISRILALKRQSLDESSSSDDEVALERAESFIPQINLKTELLELIENSKEIIFSCYSISNKEIADALVAQHKKGCKITILTDKLQSRGSSSQIEYLRANGITVYIYQKYTMHCKIYMFALEDDTHTVLTGSANLSDRVLQLHNIEQMSRLCGSAVYIHFKDFVLKMITHASPATPPPPSDPASTVVFMPILTLPDPIDDKENAAPSKSPAVKRMLRSTPKKFTPGRDGTMSGIFTGGRLLSPVPFFLPLAAP